MQLSHSLLFFFSALGAFNGFILALYLLLKKKSASDIWLSALVFAISLRVSKSVWFFFEPALAKQFLQVGLSACFLIGPLLLTFCLSHHTLSLWQSRLLNGQVFVNLILVCLIGWLYPYHINAELWGTVFYKVINWQWLSYLLLTGFLMRGQIAALLTKEFNDKIVLCSSVLVGTSVIWLAYFTASYTSYIVGALSFSFLLYLSGLTLVFSKKETSKKLEKYANKKIEHTAESELVAKLSHLMQQEQVYRDSTLSLPKLAKKLGVSVPILSQLLNDNLQLSFSKYLNQWRIEAAKTLLLEKQQLTIELVAEQVGYNSQSTFYNAFKQIEGCTPAHYRSQHLS